jgi:hypothetical protein
MNGPLIIYHSPCADGAGAAYAAWCKFGSEAEYRGAKYGDAPPTDDEVRGRDVFVLDFSYPRAVLEKLHAAAESLLILDHHKSAQEALAGLPYAMFDMGRSGAVIAWEHFHPGEVVPELLLYIQDRDIWKWELRNSKEISAALDARGMWSDFNVLCDMMTGPKKEEILDSLKGEGRVLLQMQKRYVDAILRGAERVTIDGKPALAVTSPILQSEVGHELATQPYVESLDGGGVAAVGTSYVGIIWYRDGKSKKYRVSLRSVGDLDVSAIAKKFNNGGGHRNAAGFECDELPWLGGAQ